MEDEFKSLHLEKYFREIIVDITHRKWLRKELSKFRYNIVKVNISN